MSSAVSVMKNVGGPSVLNITSRGVGSKFGLVRQILCQSSQHSVQLQSTLHAKHANARRVWGYAPPQKNSKIGCSGIESGGILQYNV